MSEINAQLAGESHPISGLPYIEQTIELLNGTEITSAFPDFSEVYAGELPETMYLASDDVHNSFMNQQLSAAVAQDPSLASQFTTEKLSQILNGETHEGYTWHHHQEPGRMELVNEQDHANQDI